MDPFVSHVLRMIVAAAISTLTLTYGLFPRKAGRRWIFFAAGILCFALTGFTLAVTSNRVIDDVPIRTFVVGGILLFVGAAAFGTGWRGRFVGDHPHCRACGFNLFGRPEGSDRCSECGADLAGRKAIVIGEKQRRKPWVVAGLFFFLLGGLIAGPMGYKVALGMNFTPYLPIAWVIDDLDNPRKLVNASNELSRRLAKSPGDPAMTRALFKRAIQSGKKTSIEYSKYLLFTVLNVSNSLDESDTRQAIRLLPLSNAMIIIPQVELDGELQCSPMYFGLTSANWSGTRVTMTKSEYSIADAPVPAESVRKIKVAEVGREVDSIRLDSFAGKLKPGAVTVRNDAEFDVQIRSGGKLITEHVKCSATNGTMLVAKGKGGLPIRPPRTVTGLIDWRATWRVEDDKPSLKIINTDTLALPNARVLARIWCVTPTNRSEIGRYEYSYYSSRVTLYDSVKIPSGPHTLELVPAPDDGKSSWSRVPIIGETIKIETIDRQ